MGHMYRRMDLQEWTVIFHFSIGVGSKIKAHLANRHVAQASSGSWLLFVEANLPSMTKAMGMSTSFVVCYNKDWLLCFADEVHCITTNDKAGSQRLQFHKRRGNANSQLESVSIGLKREAEKLTVVYRKWRITWNTGYTMKGRMRSCVGNTRWIIWCRLVSFQLGGLQRLLTN